MDPVADWRDNVRNMRVKTFVVLMVATVVQAGSGCSSSSSSRDGASGSGGGVPVGGISGAGGLSGTAGVVDAGPGNDTAFGTGGASEASLAPGTGGSSHLGGSTGPGGQVGSGGVASTGGIASAGGSASTAGAFDAGRDLDTGATPLPPALTWTRQGSSEIYEGIWGSGPRDIYAVGRSGRLVHSVGDGTWTAQSTATTSHLTGIWGSSATDLYVSVLANVILHSTGDGTWSHQTYTTGTTFRDVWGSGASDIYVVGPGAVHGTGNGSWQRPPQVVADGVTYSVWGTSATNVYVANSPDSSMLRTIYHSTGDGVWRAESTPAGAQMQTIWGADARHIFAGGGNQILFSTGDGVWTTQLTIPDTTEVVVALWGTGRDAVYACTQHGYFYRSNGAGQWSEAQPIQTPSGMGCFSMWGSAVDDIYLGTIGGIYHGTL